MANRNLRCWCLSCMGLRSTTHDDPLAKRLLGFCDSYFI